MNSSAVDELGEDELDDAEETGGAIEDEGSRIVSAFEEIEGADELGEEDERGESNGDECIGIEESKGIVFAFEEIDGTVFAFEEIDGVDELPEEDERGEGNPGDGCIGIEGSNGIDLTGDSPVSGAF